MLLQTTLLVAYARITRKQVRARWLLALSALAILTHPFLDWLNNYGMRWLMPFDGRWFCGDSVFIMDPWLWLILGVGWGAGSVGVGWWCRRCGRELCALTVVALTDFC